MELMSREMMVLDAEEIMTWRYPPPHDFYDGEISDESRRELTGGAYRAVTALDELFGFYCTGKAAQVPAGRQLGFYPDSAVDIGLGMKPDQTGSGKGAEFVLFAIREIEKCNPNQPLRLTVADFNCRAIHLYEKTGFRKTGEFQSKHAKFHVMLKEYW